MGKKIVVVGGVAGGASVAARVRRIDASAQITMFERGDHVSFSNCALPFYLSGVVARSESLVLMDPVRFKKQYDIDAKVNCEVTKIMRNEKKVQVKNHKTGECFEESYDVLVLSPGASPVKPASIRGIEKENVFTIRNVTDITRFKSYIDERKIKEVSDGKQNCYY